MIDLASIREVFVRVLEVPASEREALLTALPPQVRAEVVSLLAAHHAAGSFLEVAIDVPIPIGQRIGPYLLMEKIGEGGMGVVYRANRDDGEFQREVAIKLVGGRLFALEAERRFIAERGILALLDHPNIVRMLDGGVSQGQRYLVMELLSGEPILEYCSKRQVSAAGRLQLFQSVCAAIHYAHQRLIIHRDLKSRNIMVTAEGQVKVLDFGIARLLDQDGMEDNDATAFNPVTLSCASPEQALGERLTLATDIYSLGILLYEILTGHNPQAAGTRTEILNRIAVEEIAPPSTVSRGLASDLDAIVAKALARDPGRRYASAEEMAADIGRYLDGRPILARPPSRLYYAARFCSRNKALTFAMAALFVAIVAGAGISLALARQAEQQRLIAQRRFDEARRLTYTVIHEIQPKLAAINGTVALRKLLIEKTLVYLEALGKDAANSPPLMREIIESYIELARVSGSMGESNVGDKQTATEALQKGEALTNVLLRVDPTRPASLRAAAHLFDAAARHATWYGRGADAVKYAERSMALAEQSATIGDKDSADEVALAAFALAGVAADVKQRVSLFERSAAIWQQALGNDPSKNAILTQRVALVYRNLSSIWHDRNEFQRAIENAAKARELDEKLLLRDPSSPAAQMNLSFDVAAIGLAHYRLHNYAAAAASMRESVALREKITARNPDDHRAKDRLAFALHELARDENKLGDHNAARRDYRRAIDLYVSVSAGAPLVLQSLFKFGTSNYDLGVLELERGRRLEGCRLIHKSLELLEEYGRRNKEGEQENVMITAVRRAAGSCGP